MAYSRKDLEAQLDGLKKQADDLKKMLRPLADQDLIEPGTAVHDALRMAWQDSNRPLGQLVGYFEAAVEGPDPEGVAFPAFLEMISKSVVRAQEMLDGESERYIREAKGRPHALPSLFRMPKVTAQMKFGLDVSEGGGLNLLFYSRKHETTTRNEQAIEFEVISVPAPPDVLAKVESGVVGAVVDRSSRAFLATILKALAPSLDLGAPDDFVAISFPGPRYLVIGEAGEWLVNLAPGQEPAMAAFDADFRRELVRAIATVQRQ